MVEKNYLLWNFNISIRESSRRINASPIRKYPMLSIYPKTAACGMIIKLMPYMMHKIDSAPDKILRNKGFTLSAAFMPE